MSKHKVAVYGSLRKGLHNHSVMERAEGKHLVDTKTSFPANLRSYGSYPYVHTERVQPAEPISVEIYEVNDFGLRVLDSLEGYPSFYDRREFTFKDGTTAWMYFINNESNDHYDLVEDGDWKNYVECR